MNNTLLKGVQVIEFMASRATAVGITEIAEAVQLQRSAVHRLLQGWIEMGYVFRTEGNLYRASLKLWEVAMPLVRDLDIKRYTVDVMRELFSASGETIILSVLDHSDVVFIDKLETNARVRSYTAVGGRAPAVLTASGKVLIALASTVDVHAAIAHAKAARPDLEEYYEQLPRELEEIRRSGYARNGGHWHSDVGGVASAVMGPDGEPMAAIGLAAPIWRLDEKRMDALQPLVTAAAKRVSDDIQR